MLGLLANSAMPVLLAAVDVVATPQRQNDFTACQVPAKLLEAMAMGKSIIVSRVGDLAQIIGEGSATPRGWTVAPGSADEIADALASIAAYGDETERRAKQARAFFLQAGSTQATAERLCPILNKATAKVRLPSRTRGQSAPPSQSKT
jgi:glycosyltransferase involved in cell wall biosynthesis